MTQPEALGPVGILGGTGPLGRALGVRFARAGLSVALGSRDAERAATIAAELATPGLVGVDNPTAARCPIVLVAVPYEGHAALLAGLADTLADRLVIDCVNPLGFDKRGPYALAVPAGSAAEEAAELLPRSRVIAAFHHLSAPLVADESVTSLDCDVLVLGEDRDDVAIGQALAEHLPGVRGHYAGRLRNAGQVEALTANLIAINRRYRAHSGIRVTGLEQPR
ncbi:NADPH-dependent F420 reductase [Propionibacteriaceae bacterium Y2011]|uniref:NADPH-dependent F420 reductase n=1 Tax=Microlunatus sp. Y2014 TaxID=3418488 RepID=UPI003B4CEB7B